MGQHAPTIRRSRLIMPVNQPKFVNKAYLRNADAIVLDLEDSVPDHQKEMARTQVKDAIRAVRKGGSAVFVRVNPTSDHIEKDLRASIWPGLDGIVLPKLETKEQLQAAEQLITEIEHARGLPVQHIAVSAIIETVAGLTGLPHSLEGSQRLDSITLGAEDFSLDSGIQLGEETESALTYARLQILFSAKQANILPLGLWVALQRSQIMTSTSLTFVLHTNTDLLVRPAFTQIMLRY